MPSKQHQVDIKFELAGFYSSVTSVRKWGQLNTASVDTQFPNTCFYGGNALSPFGVDVRSTLGASIY